MAHRSENQQKSLTRLNRLKHQWSSGRIHRCHRCDPGSIPGWCICTRRLCEQKSCHHHAHIPAISHVCSNDDKWWFSNVSLTILWRHLNIFQIRLNQTSGDRNQIKEKALWSSFGRRGQPSYINLVNYDALIPNIVYVMPWRCPDSSRHPWPEKGQLLWCWFPKFAGSSSVLDSEIERIGSLLRCWFPKLSRTSSVLDSEIEWIGSLLWCWFPRFLVDLQY